MNPWQTAAERALTSLWGTDVSCTTTDTLRDEGRNRVYRLAVTGGPVASVILKASVGDVKNPYTLGDDLPGRPFRRFCSEWAGCAMLGPLGFGPTAYAGDSEHGFYLMEDLGAGESLADKLTGDDSEAATAVLLVYAKTLGQLHAVTQGQETRWHDLRHSRGGTIHNDGHSNFWQREMANFSKVCQQHAITVPADLDSELQQITEFLENPGKYLAFTPTDCCPDNHFLRGDRIVFFDCEGAAMRHALLDAAYFVMPFPTCWCTSRLPDGLPDRLLATYREHFPSGPDFNEQLTLAFTFWTFPSLTRELGAAWENEDRKWGLVTLRQRHLHRLENLLARATFTSVLPHLASVTQSLYGLLKTRWANVEPMPLYPAFRAKRDLPHV